MAKRWTQKDIERFERSKAGATTEGQRLLPFEEKEHRSRPRKKKNSEEYHLQVRCVNWLDFFYPELKERRKRFHVANQGWAGGAAAGALLKKMGKISGVADFFLLVRRDVYSGLIIDFKARGAGLSAEQQEFFESMRQEGFRCEEIDDDRAFEELIIDYLGPSKKINQWKKQHG